jgi:hypothetical protein
MKDGALAQICDRKRLAREKRKKKRCRRTENDLLVHLRRRLFQRPNRKQYRRTDNDRFPSLPIRQPTRNETSSQRSEQGGGDEEAFFAYGERTTAE